MINQIRNEEWNPYPEFEGNTFIYKGQYTNNNITSNRMEFEIQGLTADEDKLFIEVSCDSITKGKVILKKLM